MPASFTKADPEFHLLIFIIVLLFSIASERMDHTRLIIYIENRGFQRLRRQFGVSLGLQDKIGVFVEGVGNLFHV